MKLFDVFLGLFVGFIIGFHFFHSPENQCARGGTGGSASATGENSAAIGGKGGSDGPIFDSNGKQIGYRSSYFDKGRWVVEEKYK